MKILQMPCLTGACMKALVEALGRFLYQGLRKICSSSSRSFFDHLARFPDEDLAQCLLHFLAPRSCGDPTVKSCQRHLHDLVQVLARSS